MSPAQILILDLHQDPCVGGNCGHLRGLIEKAFPTGSVRVCATAQIPDSTTTEPDLIVLRFTGSLAARSDCSVTPRQMEIGIRGCRPLPTGRRRQANCWTHSCTA